MLLIEENHEGASTSQHTDNKMLCMEEDMPCGCGRRGGSIHNGGVQHEQNRRHNRNVNPLERGEVKAVPEIGKTRPK